MAYVGRKFHVVSLYSFVFCKYISFSTNYYPGTAQVIMHEIDLLEPKIDKRLFKGDVYKLWIPPPFFIVLI